MVHNKTIRQICASTTEVEQCYHKLPCNLSFCEMSHFNPNKYVSYSRVSQRFDSLLEGKMICRHIESLRTAFTLDEYVE